MQNYRTGLQFSDIYRVGGRIAAIYAGFAALWILLSDELLSLLVSDAVTLSRLQTVKGWFFVATTAGLLFLLVVRFLKAISSRDAKLNEVVLAVSQEVGEEFFASLAEHLAKALNVRYAFIGELIDPAREVVRTVAVSAGGQPAPQFEYSLYATPCANVLDGELCSYPSGVQALFPDDHLLQTMGVESYIGTPLRGAGRVPLGLVVIMDDKPLQDVELAESLLTIVAVRAANELERRRSEADLQLQFRQISTIFDSLNAIVYVASLETYELLYLNRYGVQLFGENWQGKPCYRVLQLEQPGPCAFCTNDQLVHGGKILGPCLWEFQNTVSGRWFQCIDKAIRWTNGEIVRLEIAIDISERKEMEQLQEQLISAVSHEMRTPLTAILGYAEYLRDHLVSDEERHSCLETLYGEAERLSELIDNFLQMQRFREPDVQIHRLPLAVPALLERVCHLFDFTQATHPVTIECPGDLPEILGDADGLAQVLENLLSNAIKYSPDGGAILVRAECGSNEIVISVQDAGIGLSAEQQAQVFDRFYRVDNSDRRRIGGTGLGLTLARNIVELHGGRIWVASAPGKGSTFAFSLPLQTT